LRSVVLAVSHKAKREGRQNFHALYIAPLRKS